MTRDEAIKKVAALLWGNRGTISVQSSLDAEHRATEAVDIAVALGLRLDKPKTVEQKASDALVGFQVDVTCPPRTCLTPDGCAGIVRHLQNCGFRIVRSD